MAAEESERCAELFQVTMPDQLTERLELRHAAKIEFDRARSARPEMGAEEHRLELTGHWCQLIEHVLKRVGERRCGSELPRAREPACCDRSVEAKAVTDGGIERAARRGSRAEVVESRDVRCNPRVGAGRAQAFFGLRVVRQVDKEAQAG